MPGFWSRYRANLLRYLIGTACILPWVVAAAALRVVGVEADGVLVGAAILGASTAIVVLHTRDKRKATAQTVTAGTIRSTARVYPDVLPASALVEVFEQVLSALPQRIDPALFVSFKSGELAVFCRHAHTREAQGEQPELYASTASAPPLASVWHLGDDGDWKAHQPVPEDETESGSELRYAH